MSDNALAVIGCLCLPAIWIGMAILESAPATSTAIVVIASVIAVACLSMLTWRAVRESAKINK